MIHQNRKDLPRDIPLDRLEVLRNDGKKEKSEIGKSADRDRARTGTYPTRF